MAVKNSGGEAQAPRQAQQNTRDCREDHPAGLMSDRFMSGGGLAGRAGRLHASCRFQAPRGAIRLAVHVYQ